MIDFIKAALPWVTIGLAVDFLAAHDKRQKWKNSKEIQSEQTD